MYFDVISQSLKLNSCRVIQQKKLRSDVILEVHFDFHGLTMMGEYQAHLFEIELANKKRGEFEEKILLAMDKIMRVMSAHVRLLPSGHEFLLDGTNADDLTEHRPGAAAGAEARYRAADARDANARLTTRRATRAPRARVERRRRRAR